MQGKWCRSLLRHRPGKKIVSLTLAILAVVIAVLLSWAGRTVRQERLDQAFLNAVKADDKTQVLELLNRGANVDARDMGEPPSFREVLLRLLGRLRSRGAQAENGYHPTALMLATERMDALPTFIGPIRLKIHDQDLVLILLDHGAAVNIRNTVGFTPLRNVVQTHALAVVRKLLERGAAVDAPDKYGLTPLMVADTATAQLLVAHGANVNARDRFGRTPLYMRRDDPRYLELLIAHGADVNAVDSDGITPLIEAARSGANDSIKILLKHGADLNAKDRHGQGVLWSVGSEDTLVLLRQIGAKE